MSQRRPSRSNADMSAETRSKTIAAAIASLASLGYAGTTLSNIAQRVGVSRTALVYHFEGKNALMVAVIDALYDQMGDSYRAALDPRMNAGEQLLAIFEIGYEQTRSTEQMALIELLLAARRDDGFRAEVAPTIAARDRIFQDAWHELIERYGGPRERLDLVRDFAVSVFRGITICRCLGSDADSFERQNAMLRQLLVDALR